MKDDNPNAPIPYALTETARAILAKLSPEALRLLAEARGRK